MKIKENLYAYSSISSNVFLLGKKDYKWYDKSFAKVVEIFGDLIDENKKLNPSLLMKIKQLNMPVSMIVSNKRLDLVTKNKEIIKEKINKIDMYINENKSYLDDKEFIESYNNYKNCLNQYLTFNSMEYLTNKIKEVCIKNETDPSLVEYMNIIQDYISEDIYRSCNFDFVEMYTLYPISCKEADNLFFMLIKDLQECRKMEEKIRSTSNKQ